MKFEEATYQIKRNWEKLLKNRTSIAEKQVNGKDSYVCNFCGHGKGGDGVTVIPNKENYPIKCFGCGFVGDIIAYDMKLKELSNTPKNFVKTVYNLAEELGLTIDNEDTKQDKEFSEDLSPIGSTTTDKTAITEQQTVEITESLKKNIENKESTQKLNDFSKYIEQASKNFVGSEGERYIISRGISSKTAQAYHLGYDAEADPIAAPTGEGDKLNPVKRVIIPSTPNNYLARRIDDIKEYKALNAKGSVSGVFNHEALETENNDKIICICEGAMDALSILELGYCAVSINSANIINPFLQIIDSNPNKNYPSFVLCFDDDKAGVAGSEKLKKELLKRNLKVLNADVRGSFHDINDRLQKDREGLKKNLDMINKMNSLKPNNTWDYISFHMRKDVLNYKNDIKTGFPTLDKEIKGLYPGLYCLAAIPSIGKTTFALQIADQIAKKHDVLFFSIEQGKLEIVSKSLARQCFLNANKSTNCKISSLDIRLMEKLTEPVKQSIINYHSVIGDRMSVIEGNFQLTVTQIQSQILQHIKDNETKPVVFIDYLQIIRPDESINLKSEREEINNIVTSLRILSREQQIPIIIISALNRASYNIPITLQSLKESGGIEYTCDTVWGLQLTDFSSDKFDKLTKQAEISKAINKAKNKIPREITLVGLKNRNGRASFQIDFLYYPLNEYFEEAKSNSQDDFEKALTKN